MGQRVSNGVGVSWLVKCYRGGRVLWTEFIPHNLTTTEGLNTLLDRTFKNIPGNVNWYVGLKGTGAPALADTMTAHASWAEITPYSQATRPAFVGGTITGGVLHNNSSPAAFTINSATTVYGVFFSSDNTKAGTLGLLFSAGDFGTPRVVAVDDTLSVTTTITLANL